MSSLNTLTKNQENKLSLQYITNQEGKKIAVILPIEEFESLVETLEILTDELFSQKLQASIAQAEAENTISWEEAKIKLGI
jgi:PHD/YefM family antitoxin component YafN of YafNO toxin-antitoxin module